MRIINFLTDRSLWGKAELFLLFSGRLISAESMGLTVTEITLSLKHHFGVSDRLELNLTAEIDRVIADAKCELEKYFDPVDVTIFIAGIEDTESETNKNLGGVSGYAWPNIIFLYFNPQRDWERLLFRTAIHEFNHCQRFLYHDPYASFIDWVIFEGLAESFEGELVPDSNVGRMDAKELQLYLPKVEKFWNSMPSDAGDWFFGNQDKGIPFALGYQLGYLLVENFRKKNPLMPWQELVTLPAKAFAP